MTPILPQGKTLPIVIKIFYLSPLNLLHYCRPFNAALRSIFHLENLCLLSPVFICVCLVFSCALIWYCSWYWLGKESATQCETDRRSRCSVELLCIVVWTSLRQCKYCCSSVDIKFVFLSLFMGYKSSLNLRRWIWLWGLTHGQTSTLGILKVQTLQSLLIPPRPTITLILFGSGWGCCRRTVVKWKDNSLRRFTCNGCGWYHVTPHSVWQLFTEVLGTSIVPLLNNKGVSSMPFQL